MLSIDVDQKQPTPFHRISGETLTTTKIGVRRIICLTLGWEDLPKSVSIFGDTSGERLTEPVPAVLLECDGGWLLLDTGLNPALIRDAALYRRFHGGNHGIEAILPGPGEPLIDALDVAGVKVDEIVAVAVSHLHNDHAGGLRHFAGGVPIHVQQRELDYALSDHPGPEQHGLFRIDYDDPNLRWVMAEGDVEIAPGVTAIESPGHTPGHQSFLVELDSSVGGGGYVFAFDAADLTENIENEVAVGGFINCSPDDTVAQIRRLKSIAIERGYRLVPGHDPVVWPELTNAFTKQFGSFA